MPADFNNYVNMIAEDVSPGDIYIGAIDLARLTLPEWKIRQGTPEDALLQAAAHMNHLTVSYINRLPPRIMEGVGRLIGITKDEGSRASIEVTFTLNQDTGIDMPAGTQFYYEITSGGEQFQYNYETITDIVVADWSGTPASISVLLKSTEVGIHPVVATGTEFISQSVMFEIESVLAQQSGTAQTGTSTSITLAATASATDDYYNNNTIEITGGTGQSTTKATITDYVGSSKVATVASWPSGTPDATSVYRIDRTFLNGANPEDPQNYLSRVRNHIEGMSTAITKVSHAKQSLLSSKDYIKRVKAYDLTNSGGTYPRLLAAPNDLGYMTIFTYGQNRQLTTAEKQEVETYVADKSVAGLTVGCLDMDLIDFEVTVDVKYDSVYNQAALTTDLKNAILRAFSPSGFSGSDEGFTVGDVSTVCMNSGGVLFVDSVTLSVASGNSSSGTAHSSLYNVTSGNIVFLAKGILPKLTSANLTTNLTAVTVS